MAGVLKNRVAFSRPHCRNLGGAGGALFSLGFEPQRSFSYEMLLVSGLPNFVPVRRVSTSSLAMSSRDFDFRHEFRNILTACRERGTESIGRVSLNERFSGCMFGPLLSNSGFSGP